MAARFRWTLPIIVVLLPAVVYVLLFVSPPLDQELHLPLVNFFAVTAVAVVASGIALVLAVASVRIRAYRVLFVTLGFVVMGFLYGIDGITTPGVLFHDSGADSFDRSVAGVSAFLGLCLPSLFFATGYTRLMGFLERRLPFSPAHALLVTLIAGLAVYGAFALAFSDLMAGLPLSQPPFVFAVVLSSLALVAFAA